MQDLTGQKFNYLTVLKLDHKKRYCYKGLSQGFHYFWLCKCDCGNKVVVDGTHLKNGHSKSCGCYKAKRTSETHTTHGLSNSRINRIYRKMKGRCYNSNNPKYYCYGARGITICDEWKNDFKAFYDWSIQNGYKDNLSIDRIDVNGNYEPSNCRWATNLQQANNKTINHYLIYNNEKHTIAEWSRITGFPKSSISYRIKKNWTIKDILTKPIRGSKCQK